MAGAEDEAYLAGLPDEQRAELAAVNKTGLARMREYIAEGQAIAFVGAGASAPLYPLWNDVIAELVEQATGRMSEAEGATCRALAATSPDAVVEIVRQRLRPEVYREVLRDVFRVRRDRESGRAWTPTHELIVRCDFRGVVTTNYDPGIVDARMKVRPDASSTGFASWTDETTMDGWRSGDIFEGRDVLPVLFAHGQHNRPEEIVLATTEYRKAYAGKLALVLGQLVAGTHLVWIGFSFADQRIAAILREIAQGSGTRIDPGVAPRHVAILPWDPAPTTDDGPRDPGVLRDLGGIQYGADVVLYPAPDGDHAALGALLERFVDPRFPAVDAPAPRVEPARGAPPAAQDEQRSDPAMVVRWVHGGDPLERFAGRADELAKLDRWAADPEVRLIGVTAWGGAGKTALVTQWLAAGNGAARRRGLFAWSFYENASEDAWAEDLLAWARTALGIDVAGDRLADRVLVLVRTIPIVLVLDGLERVQEGPGGTDYGRLLGGLLRAVLTGLCRLDHGGLAVLTSRFVFADLEQFDGTESRMLDVPPFTVGEGADLLARAGAGWLPADSRRELVAAVDGHALAVGALAGALEHRPPTGELRELMADLGRAARTNERVQRVLAFYADRLSESDRALIAIVALFQRPVAPSTVLALGSTHILDGALRRWDAADVQAAVQQRLGGLLSWHGDATVSAHPLVRDSFRALALSADSATLASNLELDDLPAGAVRIREHAERLIEMIELLLDAGEWEVARELYRARTSDGDIFKTLPAARLGMRCGLAFVGTPERRSRCVQELSEHLLGVSLTSVGLHGMNAGELATAEQYLRAAIDDDRRLRDQHGLAIDLRNWSQCLVWTGRADRAEVAASEALTIEEALADRVGTMRSRHYLGQALHLAGQTAAADAAYLAADRIAYADRGEHLEPVAGSRWAQMLLDTCRVPAARRMVEVAYESSQRHGWNASLARCERLLARCELAEPPTAGIARLGRAAAILREGDYLPDLARTLIDLAELLRGNGRSEDAVATCNEAIGIASPRGLVPVHASALAVRARVRADARTSSDRHRARDDADHALRLATRIRQLPWQELDALDAHAHIDRGGGKDNGWAAKAATLRTALIPAGLDPDPLATIEAEDAAAREAEASESD